MGTLTCDAVTDTASHTDRPRALLAVSLRRVESSHGNPTKPTSPSATGRHVPIRSHATCLGHACSSQFDDPYHSPLSPGRRAQSRLHQSSPSDYPSRGNTWRQAMPAHAIPCDGRLPMTGLPPAVPTFRAQPCHAFSRPSWPNIWTSHAYSTCPTWPSSGLADEPSPVMSHLCESTFQALPSLSCPTGHFTPCALRTASSLAWPTGHDFPRPCHARRREGASLTVDVPLSAQAGLELDARIKRAIRSYHHRAEDIVRADLASSAALAFLQMRPPADAGERAAGIAEGLEMAVRTLLCLAGVDTPDNHQEAPDARP